MTQVAPINTQPIIIIQNDESKQKKNGRHIFPAFASAVVPGIGQTLNGEASKGLMHLGAFVGLGILGSKSIKASKGKKFAAIKDFISRGRDFIKTAQGNIQAEMALAKKFEAENIPKLKKAVLKSKALKIAGASAFVLVGATRLGSFIQAYRSNKE